MNGRVLTLEEWTLITIDEVRNNRRLRQASGSRRQKEKDN